MRIDPQVSDHSVEKMRNGLRKEMKQIQTFVRNFDVNAKDKAYHKKVARHLYKMMLSLNKLVFLKKQQEILDSIRDLYGMVGLPKKGIQRKWDLNHAQLLRERDALNECEHEFWMISF